MLQLVKKMELEKEIVLRTVFLSASRIQHHGGKSNLSLRRIKTLSRIILVSSYGITKR